MSEPEILSKETAQRILTRAGEIELEGIRVDSLRAAALEAGISPAAFDAALSEATAKPIAQVATLRRRSRRLLIGSVLGAITLALFATVAVAKRKPVRAPLENFAVPVECIAIDDAFLFAQTILNRPGNSVGISRDGAGLQIRGTLEQKVQLGALLRRKASTCSPTGGPR